MVIGIALTFVSTLMGDMWALSAIVLTNGIATGGSLVSLSLDI